MPRPIFQDIIPPDKKSIRRVPMPERQIQRSTPPVQPPPQRSPLQPQAQPEHLRTFTRPEFENENAFIPPPPREREHLSSRDRFKKDRIRLEPHKRNGKGRYVIIGIITILIVLLVGAYIIGPRIAGAKILITPKKQSVIVDTHLLALKQQITPTDLTFQIMTLSKDGKEPVQATGSENVSVKASGTIIVYNNYSAVPQILVKNTRFQTPEGLIFRSAETTTIPGKSNGLPGSMQLIVNADAPGTQYNIGMEDFTIPGFKGEPRYTKFYARSKTQMSGGFIGIRSKIDPLSLKKAQDFIHSDLTNQLLKEAVAEKPDGYVLFNTAYFVEYQSLPTTSEANGVVDVSERVTLHAIIFEKNNLIQNIAKNSNVNYDLTQIDIVDWNTIAFIYKNDGSPQPWMNDKLVFNLKGQAQGVWKIDSDKLKNEFAGKPRKNLNAILAGYTGIEKAEAIISPFWQTSFPTDTSKITVTVVQPE